VAGRDGEWGSVYLSQEFDNLISIKGIGLIPLASGNGIHHAHHLSVNIHQRGTRVARSERRADL